MTSAVYCSKSKSCPYQWPIGGSAKRLSSPSTGPKHALHFRSSHIEFLVQVDE